MNDMSSVNHDHRRPDHFPRAALWAAAALIVAAVVFAAAGRQLGTGDNLAVDSAQPIHVDLHFRDRDDGGVAVLDGVTGAPLTIIEPGTNGFIRGVLRGLARERRLHELGQAQPFRLARWPDGRLTLDDPATGRHIELASFGHTNQAAFAELWAATRRGASATEETTFRGDSTHAEFSAAENH